MMIMISMAVFFTLDVPVTSRYNPRNSSLIATMGPIISSTQGHAFGESCHEFCVTKKNPCLTGLGFKRMVADDIQSCEALCLYTGPCHRYSYNLLTSQCTLYSENDSLSSLHSFTKLDSNRYYIMGEKSCSLARQERHIPCKDTEELLNLGNQGVVIQNRYNGKCLNVRNNGPMMWDDCASPALWTFSARGEIYNKMGNSTNGEVQVSISLIEPEDRKKCLSANFNSNDQGHIILVPCSPSDPRQALELRQNSLLIQERCYHTLYANQNGPLSIRQSVRDDKGEQLTYKFYLVQRSEIRKGAICFKEKLSVKNGQLIGNSKQNYFVPDSNITLQCDQGYGIEKQGWPTRATVKCEGKKTRLPKCSKVKLMLATTKNVSATVSVMINVVQAGIILSLVAALVTIKRSTVSDKDDTKTQEQL